MGDKPLKFPPKDVLDSLLRLKIANSEEIAAINGDLGDRLKNMYEHYSDFDGKCWRLFSEIGKLFNSNELKARERVRLYRGVLDCIVDHMDRNGHTADIAEMAAKAAEKPVGSQPKEPAEAEQAGEEGLATNVVQLDPGAKKTSAKGKAKTEKKPAAEAKPDKPKDSVDAFREELRSTIDQGDKLIKEVNDEDEGKGKKKSAASKRPAAPPEPAAASGEMPDIPPGLDRRTSRARTPDPEKESHGKYQLLR